MNHPTDLQFIPDQNLTPAEHTNYLRRFHKGEDVYAYFNGSFWNIWDVTIRIPICPVAQRVWRIWAPVINQSEQSADQPKVSIVLAKPYFSALQTAEAIADISIYCHCANDPVKLGKQLFALENWLNLQQDEPARWDGAWIEF